MIKALLIIDVQEALCSGEEECYNIPQVMKVINNLSVRARKSCNTIVVIIQHEAKGESLERDTPGWQLAQQLIVDKEDLRSYKETTDSFHKTNLLELLQSHKVDSLIICGLQSDYCVDSTTRRALSLGFDVELVVDGHSTEDNDVLTGPQITAHHNATLGSLTSFDKSVRLIKGEDVQC